LTKILRYWLPVVAWAVLISLFSTDTFHEGATGGFVRSLLLSLFLDLSEWAIEFIHAGVRKLAHVFEYFVFTVLLYRAFRRGRSNGGERHWALLSLLVAVGFAGFDEFHQGFEAKRIGSLTDVGVDTLGVLAAQLLLWGNGRRSSRD
jgi:VanZ family protein